MKRLLLVFVGLVVLGGSVNAKTKQKDEPKPALPMQTMNMNSGAMGPLCPMMDTMPVMLQVMKLQQKLDEGVSGSERKEIIADKAKLIAVLDSATVRMQSTPMPCMSMQMPCAPAPANKK